MVKKFLQFEEWVAARFSLWSQTNHWFFFWFIFFFVWTIFREFFRPVWYNDQIDLLVITWASAVLPFWTENSLKIVQAHQSKVQEEQMKIMKDQQEAVLRLAQINQELARKILVSIEDVQEGISDLTEAGEEETHDKG